MQETIKSEIQRQLEAARAAGRTLYSMHVDGENEDGSPTHGNLVDWDTGEGLSPWFALEGEAEQAVFARFEQDHPDSVEVVVLMDEIRESISHTWPDVDESLVEICGPPAGL